MTWQERDAERKRINQSIKDVVLSSCLPQEDVQRINSIINNDGFYLKKYKPENRTIPVCLAAVMKDGLAIEFVPEHIRTKDICNAACISDGLALMYVPEEIKNAEICKNAVLNNGIALKYVPEKYKTQQMCGIAVTNTGTALEFVPEEYVNEKLCKAAAIQSKDAFAFIPKSYITPAFCASIVNEKGSEWIEGLPKELRNSAFYNELVKLAPSVIWNVPSKYRNAIFCNNYLSAMHYKSAGEAIRKDDRMIGLFHHSLYDHETCLAIVQSKAFKKVIHSNYKVFMRSEDDLKMEYGTIHFRHLLKFPDVIQFAVKLDASLAKYAPLDMFSQDIVNILADSNDGFSYIPSHYKTKELCEKAFKKDPYNITEIPNEYLTEKMCLQAVKYSGFLLQYIPENMKTAQMCRIAVEDEGNGLPYVPCHLINKEMAYFILNHVPAYGFPLKHIPEAILDYELCLEAVKKYGDNLGDVPTKLRDHDMCLAAIVSHVHAARFIPYDSFAPDIVLYLAKDPYCLKYVPEDKMTEEAAYEAVSHSLLMEDGVKISNIPERLLTKKVCERAFETNMSALYGIPEEFITEKMLLEVSRAKKPWILRYVYRRLISEDLKRFIESLVPDL